MAGETSIGTRTAALVERGELKQALKALERERRDAVARGDAASVEDVFRAVKLVYGRADGKRRSEAGRISFAAQQNMRFLGRQAAIASGAEWSDPFPDDPRPAPRDPALKRALFGEARRPLSLVLAVLVSIASFFVWSVVSLFAWGMGDNSSNGEPDPLPPDGARHEYRIVLIVAASLAFASLVATTLDWVRARRRVPAEERLRSTQDEVVIYAVAALLVLGAAIAFFAYLWIEMPLRIDLAPYSTP
jgi:hypothetical protein